MSYLSVIGGEREDWVRGVRRRRWSNKRFPTFGYTEIYKNAGPQAPWKVLSQNKKFSPVKICLGAQGPGCFNVIWKICHTRAHSCPRDKTNCFEGAQPSNWDSTRVRRWLIFSSHKFGHGVLAPTSGFDWSYELCTVRDFWLFFYCLYMKRLVEIWAP